MTAEKPHLIMIRPAAQNNSFLAALGDVSDRAVLHQAPLVSVKFSDAKLPQTTGQVFVFTSANGVAAYVAQHTPNGARAYCVNQTTSDVAQKAGFDAIAGPKDAKALANLIPEGDVIYIRAREVAFDMASALKKRGVNCEEHIAYSQEAQSFDSQTKDIIETHDCVIPVFSAFAAQILADQLKTIQTKHLTLLCISEHVAQMLLDYPNVNIFIADQQNRTGMIKKLAVIL